MWKSLFVVCALAIAQTDAVAAEFQWGQSGDVPVPRDFDGDGRADFVVWRPSDGMWHVRGSAGLYLRSEQWGQSGDVPVPADFDGDGRIDYVVWRPSDGVWYVKNGVTGAFVRADQWGMQGDVPVPGDYDADGRTDFAIWRPSTGVWWVKSAVTGAVRAQTWGEPGDIPVPGKHDGVAGDDFAIWRPSTGVWWTLGSSTNAVVTQQWGTNGDVPTTGRFCTDTVSKTVWRWWQSGAWYTPHQPAMLLGQLDDRPVPANFLGDVMDEHAVWRPSTGTWYIEPSNCDRWALAGTRIEAATANVRGLSVVAVKNGNIVFNRGAGWANGNTLATPDIPFQIASISKLFIGTSVLMLAESGQINLDGGAGWLNPNNSAMPTVRDHANHTSGTKNGACYSIGNFEPSSNLSQETSCLAFASTWENRLPGTQAEYSNIGAAWPARLVEWHSGIDFDLFTRTRIFTPLQMNSSAWFQYQLAGRPISIGYGDNGAPTNQTGVTPYPVGNLRASANDLGRFMIMWTSQGVAANGQRLLQSSTVASAFTLQRPTVSDFGFYWAQAQTLSRRTVWGHGGVMDGVCTRLTIDPVTREGVAILTNGSCGEANTDINEIEDRVMRTLQDL